MPQPALTDAQLTEVMSALEKYGTITEAAKALGLPRNTFDSRVKAARARAIGSTTFQLAVAHGSSPAHDLTHPVPAPLILRGVSTYYDKDGNATGQWVKSKMDDLKLQAAIEAAVMAMAKDLPRTKPEPPPTLTSEALCNLYTLTDSHVGMYAWEKEAGADWDLAIAERTLRGAFDYLVEASPPAKVGIVLNLGDFLHYDSLSAITPQHGNLLDADSRFSKMVRVGIDILRYVIRKALQKHEKVIVIAAEGNHDPASSVWFRHLLRTLYENEPRVTVIDNETPYIVYLHGKTMLSFHHGHLTKKDQLPLLFAAQYPKEWGLATKRYCHTGHQHHLDEKEHAGMKVKQHATIAARDAYAARGGWVADRQIEAITYHSEFGQVATVTVTPEMLEPSK